MSPGLARGDILSLLDDLNDELRGQGGAVKGFLPGPDPQAIRFYEGDALTVDVASARYLLAMKLFASRVEADARDIAFLYRQLGFTTVEEGLEQSEKLASSRAVDPLAAARRHAEETAAAQERMLASARARRAAILEAHNNSMSVRRIAAELGCSPAVVQEAIRLGRSEVRTEGDKSQ